MIDMKTLSPQTICMRLINKLGSLNNTVDSSW